MKILQSVYDCKGMNKGEWFKVQNSEYEILSVNNTCADLIRFDYSGYNETHIIFAEREKFE